jgi:hypothetical protein
VKATAETPRAEKNQNLNQGALGATVGAQGKPSEFRDFGASLAVEIYSTRSWV